MTNDDEGRVANWLIVCAVTANYWGVSIAMIVMNRYLLGGDQIPLDAPVFVTWLQCVVAVISCGLLGACKQACSDVAMLARFHPFQCDSLLMCKVLPLSLTFAGMLTFNNLCLKYVGVAFYNVGRSLTIVFNVLLTFLLLGTTVSARVLGACGVIALGFLLGVEEEGSGQLGLDSTLLLGVLFGCLSSLCVAVNGVLTQTLLSSDVKDTWLLTYYNNLNGVAVLLPVLFVFGELDAVAANVDVLLSWQFWLINAAAGFLGVALGLASMLSISYTSALTHNVSSTAKSSLQTAGAVFYSGDHKSALWWLSNAIVLAGSFAYAWFRHDESQLSAADNSSDAEKQADPAAGSVTT